MNRILIENLIAKHEGRKSSVYKDSEGLLTIGIGFNLEAPAALAICQQFGLDHAALMNGTAILTGDQIDEIFQYQLNKVLQQAQVTLPTFNTMPDEVQAVVCDQIFQLGWAGFQKFQNEIACLKSGSWKDAAANLLDSTYAKQTPNRAQENAAILEAA
jgi:lysozyme